MRDKFIRTANLMRSTPTLPAHNAALKKSNSELLSGLAHALQHPDDTMDKIADERGEYEITTKLFFLPQQQQQDKVQDEKEQASAFIASSIAQVKQLLGVEDIDLLILSFPNIVLDAEDTGVFSAREFEGIKTLYAAACTCVDAGHVKTLGVAEFSASRLQQLCEAINVSSSQKKGGPRLQHRPQVNQINLKDCCVTPRDLIVYAKQEGVKLFTHSDPSDILPTETLRQLLRDRPDGSTPAAGIDKVEPLWVCKYTAVASNRGVVENKGYVVALDG